MFVGDVPTGSECGCVCPGCGQALIARNRPSTTRVRAYHFAHASQKESRCSGGLETQIHQLAKQCIASADALRIPAWTGTLDNSLVGGRLAAPTICFPAYMQRLSGAGALEVPLAKGLIRADATCTAKIGTADVELAIEIAVHHPVDDDKARLAASEHLTMVELDLSGLGSENIASLAEFSRFVIDEAPRRWINLGSPELLADNVPEHVYWVVSESIELVDIPTKAGGSIRVRQQAAVSFGSEGWKRPLKIEVPDVIMPRRQTLPVYPIGLHVKHVDTRMSPWCFKTHLAAVSTVIAPPETQLPLF